MQGQDMQPTKRRTNTNVFFSMKQFSNTYLPHILGMLFNALSPFVFLNTLYYCFLLTSIFIPTRALLESKPIHFETVPLICMTRLIKLCSWVL